ncbi:MAG: hypothetical protein WBA00_13525 [Rhodococcus sp. (in: high G+C Gram-positive bacteria)]
MDRSQFEQLKQTLNDAKDAVKDARDSLRALETFGGSEEAVEEARLALKLREHARTHAQLAVNACKPGLKQRRAAEDRRRAHALEWAEELKADRDAAEIEQLAQIQAEREYNDSTRSSVRALPGGLPGSKRR